MAPHDVSPVRIRTRLLLKSIFRSAKNSISRMTERGSPNTAVSTTLDIRTTYATLVARQLELFSLNYRQILYLLTPSQRDRGTFHPGYLRGNIVSTIPPVLNWVPVYNPKWQRFDRVLSKLLFSSGLETTFTENGPANARWQKLVFMTGQPCTECNSELPLNEPKMTEKLKYRPCPRSGLQLLRGKHRSSSEYRMLEEIT